MLHYNATWHGLCDKYRGGFGRYFLQGGGTSKGDEFLDHDEEWLLDVSSQLIKRTKTPPKGAEVSGRVCAVCVRVRVCCVRYYMLIQV